MKLIAATSFFSANAAVVLEGSDKIVTTNHEISKMVVMDSGMMAFIDGNGSLNTFNNNGAEQRIVDNFESILSHGDQLIAASNRHLHFFVGRLGEFKFLKKIKIIAAADEQGANEIVYLATNRHAQGQAIVSIDAKGHARVTSLQSNVTVKLENLAHCEKPHQVAPITEQRRQFMFVCSRSIALVDISEKKTIKSSGPIHEDKITQFRCSPVNFNLGCTTSLDKTLKLVDIQKCQVISCLTLEHPLSCARFISAGSLLVGTLAGTIHECNIETDRITTVTDAIVYPVSDVIQIDETFEYQTAVMTPDLATPVTPKLNMSTMSTDSDSSCMTPGFMQQLNLRTPLAEKQLANSPVSRIDHEPRIQSTPITTKPGLTSTRVFFPSPAKNNAKQSPMAKQAMSPNVPCNVMTSNETNSQILDAIMGLREEMKDLKLTVTQSLDQVKRDVDQIKGDVTLLKKCLVQPALQQEGPESEHEWSHFTNELRDWHVPEQSNWYGFGFGNEYSHNQFSIANAIFKYGHLSEMRDKIALLASEAKERIDNRREDENQNRSDIGVLDERLHQVESAIQRAVNVNGGRLIAKRWQGPSIE